MERSDDRAVLMPLRREEFVRVEVEGCLVAIQGEVALYLEIRRQKKRP